MKRIKYKTGQHRVFRALLRGVAVGCAIDFVVIGITGRLYLCVWYLGASVVAGALSYWLEYEKSQKIDYPLIGVRGFYIGDNGKLYSLTSRGWWEVGVNHARCLHMTNGPLGNRQPTVKDAHTAPAKGCHCGFNAYHSLQELHDSGYTYQVAAIVRGWGQARLHPEGWRSEYGEILAIVDERFDVWVGSPAHRPLGVVGAVRDRIKLDAASMRYGVPVLTSKQAEQCLSEYGTTVAEELRPVRR